MTHDAAAPEACPPPTVVVLGARDRSRETLRRSFPKRRGRLCLVRSRADVLATLRDEMVDAVVLDLGTTAGEAWDAASLARDFPSIPFFALAPVRPADAPALWRGIEEFEFTDILAEGVDDGAQRELVLRSTFTTRFALALQDAAGAVGLESPLQRHVWRLVIAHGGRTVRTESIAAAVKLTREHLSRRFSSGGAPNLKRIIDLCRLLAAAELAKNPGYDLPDVARILGFASASHMSSSAQRVLGVRPASLVRLRPGDLIDRFMKQGKGRSRRPSAEGAPAGASTPRPVRSTQRPGTPAARRRSPGS